MPDRHTVVPLGAKEMERAIQVREWLIVEPLQSA